MELKGVIFIKYLLILAEKNDSPEKFCAPTSVKSTRS